MKNSWKWIIGIVLGLIVIAVLVGVGFMVFGRFHVYTGEARIVQGFSDDGRGPGMMPYGGFGQIRGPGMMGRGFNPLGGLIGGLFSLAFLALAVMGVIWLVDHLRMPKQAVAVPAAMPVETPAVITTPCKKCGQSLHDDWKVCPYCGKRV
jgi:hypothetical protein